MKILFVAGRHAYGDARRGDSYEYANMLPAMEALGHEVVHFESFDRAAYSDFGDLNEAFLASVMRERPDAVIFVLQLYELWTETLDLARRVSPSVIIGWGPDDSWKYGQLARFVAPHVDCWATTSEEAYARAVRDGHSNFVLTQWAAADTLLAEPKRGADCRYAVSFVGAAYGNRRKWIGALAKRGIHVNCFGNGWPGGAVSGEDVVRIIRDSVISLNFGDSGLHFSGLLPYRSRQIKARVFEVPGAGGFLMTETAPNLDRYYRPGHEVSTFDTADELASQIRYFLGRLSERDQVAWAGHARTAIEHTYTRRFSSLLSAASAVRASSRAEVAEPLSSREAQVQMRELVARHRRLRWKGEIRRVLAAPFSIAIGEKRGLRAARRLAYELSWRLAGARTYSAAGLPARLFYRES